MIFEGRKNPELFRKKTKRESRVVVIIIASHSHDTFKIDAFGESRAFFFFFLRNRAVPGFVRALFIEETSRI